jgi:hypothetical protein
MPDRGGEYLEAFRRGAGIPHLGQHTIPANETTVFLRVEGLGSMTARLILCVCRFSGPDVRRLFPSNPNFRRPLRTLNPHSADTKTTCF